MLIASRGPATGTGPEGMALKESGLGEIVSYWLTLTCDRGGCKTPPDVLGRAPLE